MKLQVAIVLIGSVVPIVFGQKQCGDRQKCIPFDECPDFRAYRGKQYQHWPPAVKKEAQKLYCGKQQNQGRTIIKICCNLLDLKNCGKQAVDRIAHGRIAKVFQFPWMALLAGINGDFHCGGTLITESFVLTAAHCNRQRTVFVRVGETDLSSKIDCNNEDYSEEDCAEEPQDIPVAKFIKHNKYSTSKRRNDIALIKLEKPAQLNDNVRPICLPLREMRPKRMPEKMIVSGWGFTEGRDEISKELRFAYVPIVQQSRCQQSVRKLTDVLTVDESQVCAGDDSDLADNCKGDSGGPLQYFGRNATLIHGIVSWGMDTCGKEKAPGVYTKVSHYETWILHNLKFSDS